MKLLKEIIQYCKQTKGFSLIELIIVVATVLFFSGLLLTQYGNFIEQSRLKTEANKLRDVLELAKKKTLAREIVSSCITGFDGYKVNINSNDYNVLFCCGDTCDSNNPVLSSSLTSQTNTVSIVSGTGSIQFIPSLKGTSLTSDTTITLKNTAIGSSNKCIQVTVTKVGIVGVADSFSSC
jgi:prepilin-type N-terminal cleavage/methylation domain-containing protein